MTAKEYLNQAREIDALIHSKLRELDYWRDLSRRISGSHFEEQHKCGGLMHVPNPYGSQVDVFYYEKMIPIWYKKLFYLLNQHVIHMVGGEQMYCIVMCGDKNGNPHGYLFESVQNEPD